MRHYPVLLIILLSLLLVTPTISDPYENLADTVWVIDDPIPDPRPTIQINFGENPVDVTEYRIYYAEPEYEGMSVGSFSASAVNPQGGISTDYLFIPGPNTYLLNTRYTLFAVAEDLDNNVVTVSVNFTVESDAPTVHIENPTNSYFPDDATYAMADSNTFDLAVRIRERPVDACKFVFMDTYTDDYETVDPEYAFTHLYAPNTFTTDDGGRTFHSDGFSMVGRTEGELYVLLIFCQEYNEEYFLRPLKIGYDTTPPVITFTAEDVTDPTYPLTLLNATTDDNAFCRFTNPVYPEMASIYRITFPSKTVTSEANYAQENAEEAHFSAVASVAPASEPPYDYTFNVTCENIAGLTSWRTEDVQIDFADTLIITPHEPGLYAGDNRVPIEFATNMQSTCVLELEGEQIPLSSDGRRFTATTSSLGPGAYSYDIACVSQNGLNADYSSGFTIDRTGPTNTNITNAPTVLCGGDNIEADFEADDDVSGVDYFNYTISHYNASSRTTTKIVDGDTTSGSIDIDITGAEGDRFTISVIAVDEAGNSGRTPATATILYHEMSHPSCDRTAPQTWATQTPSATGVGIVVNISCTDSGSGCKNIIHSYEVAPTQACIRNESHYTDATKRVGTPFTITENVRFCWYVEDNADPINRGFNNVSVSGNLGITIIAPTFGVSPNKTFDFTIRTAEAANCRHGDYRDYAGRGPRELYETLVARGDETLFVTGNGLTHTVDDFDGVDDTPAERLVAWVVACESEDQTLYGAQQFQLGYDTTPPIITPSLDTDNPIIEPSIDHAEFIIDVNEDSLCTYLQPTISPYPLPGMTSPFRYNFNNPQSNQHSDLLNRDYYQQEFSVRIPEHDERYFYSSTSVAYPYLIRCTNLAGRTSEMPYDVVIEPSNDIAVTIHTPRYVRSQSVLINATTVLRADCVFSIGNIESQSLTAQQQDRYHSATINLANSADSYDLYVVCTSIDSDLDGTAESTITVDSKAPGATNITAPTSTCSLSEAPRIRMQANDGEDGSGIDYYEYTLTDGSNVTTHSSSSETVTLPLETPLTDEDTFTVRARAYDNAGNVGAWSPIATIKATGPRNIDCDERNPIGWYERRDTPQGADVTIHCQDNESGCADTYQYGFISRGETCEATTWRTSGTGYSRSAYSSVISVTDDQVLCWRVRDKKGNTYTAPPLDLTVSMSIELTSPSFGIGPETTYDLTYTTSASSDCKVDFLNPGSPATLSDWYGQLTMEFDTTGGSTHTINDFDIIERGASSCAGRSECTVPTVIICRENSRHHYAVHEVGFDTSDPVLTRAEARPNPVRTAGNLQSTLYVESDDEVWCRYVREDNGESYAFAQNPDIDDPTQYVTEQEKFLGYFSPPPAGTSSYTIDYDVTCVNLAGREAEATITLTIAPTNEVGITIHNDDAYDTRAITIEATTDLPATCSYAFNPNHPPVAFRTTGTTEHSTTYSFVTDGEYDLIVSCDATSGPYTESVSHHMMIDSIGPRMLEIATQSATCSLETITATLVSNATIIGLDGYNYSITDATGYMLVDWTTVDASGTYHLEEDMDLTAGQVYKIQAQAIDNFGRKSNILAASVTARDETYTSCDFEPPEADLTLDQVYGGYDAYVECEDDGSGCTSTFDFQRSTGMCNGTYQTKYYASQPQHLTSSGRACAIVYDKAGLNDSDSQAFTIVEHCSNGIQDPEEDGVDCGSPCPPCTCDNGRQDVNEEGVDCGGTCPDNCEGDPDGYCGNDIAEPGEECDGDASVTCSFIGFAGGTISCDDECELDTSGCTPEDEPHCGNGIVEAGEDCDGSVSSALSCEDFGLISGTLSCSNCKLSTSNCEGNEDGHCGDGIIGPGESCDKGFQSLTCESFGLISGKLTCDSACDIDTSTCFNGYCGDGEIDQGESCDGLEWGDVADCTDISDDFSGGMPICGLDCHFNTRDCIEREGAGKQKGAFCISDDNCKSTEECKDNECVKKAGTGTQGGTAKDCSTDVECPVGTNCIAGKCTTTTPPLPPPPEKHTAGLILLIIGLVLALGGGGYLIYTTYINPPPAAVDTGSPGTPGAPGTTEAPPTETPQQRAARLELERKKRALQEQAKKKAQNEKAKQRKALLSSFEEDELAKKGKAADGEKAVEKKQETPAKDDAQKAVKKAPKKLAQQEDEDVFSELETISKGEVPKEAAKSTEDVFNDLAELSGHSKNKVKTTINKNALTSDELVKLFENADRKAMTPKSLTPAFKHLIDKGKLEHATVHEAVHKLHEQEKLTHLQKEKILKDLELIGEGK